MAIKGKKNGNKEIKEATVTKATILAANTIDDKKAPPKDVLLDRGITVKKLKALLKSYPADAKILIAGCDDGNLAYNAESNTLNLTIDHTKACDEYKGGEDPCEACENAEECAAQEQRSVKVPSSIHILATAFRDANDIDPDGSKVQAACDDLAIDPDWFYHLIRDIAGSSMDLEMDESIYQRFLMVMGHVLTNSVVEDRIIDLDVDGETLDVLRRVESIAIWTKILVNIRTAYDGTSAEQLDVDDMAILLRSLVPDGASAMSIRHSGPWTLVVKYRTHVSDCFDGIFKAYKKIVDIEDNKDTSPDKSIMNDKKILSVCDYAKDGKCIEADDDEDDD